MARRRPVAPPRLPVDRRSAGSQLQAFELLANAVVVVDSEGIALYMNPAAEQIFEMSARMALGHSFARMFVDGSGLARMIEKAQQRAYDEMRLDLHLARPLRQPIQVQATASGIGSGEDAAVLLEFSPLDQRARMDRDEHLLDAVRVNKELVRNLAHEIRNPLGGLRGAAQLLQGELDSPALQEYTQVIIKEADRLQSLVDRLLAPHRQPRQMGELNIHEVCERVRTLVQAEFGAGLEIARDYDASLPDLRGDLEQLIQAVMNLVRNAAQAMHGRGRITLRTRVARAITIARQRWKLALELRVIDNGPGVPDEIRDRIFLPLVSGKDGGTGLGLTLAQTFVQQHGGLIECESRPGRTDFRILLPLA